MPTDRLQQAIQYLADAGHRELAVLLEGSGVSVAELPIEDWPGASRTGLQIHSIPAVCDCLRSLSPEAHDAILRALAYQVVGDAAAAPQFALDCAADWSRESIAPRTELLAELLAQKSLLLEIAVRRRRLDTAEEEYKARSTRLSRLLPDFGLPDPSPYPNLKSWYLDYREKMPTWMERRNHIENLYRDAIRSLIASDTPQLVRREPSGWDQINQRIARAYSRLETAGAPDHYQSVGLKCREVIIALGRIVYDASKHKDPDGKDIGRSDGPGMLLAFMTTEFRGGSNEALRRFVRGAHDLSNSLQHRETANANDAAICLEATVALVRVVTLLHGNSAARLETRDESANQED